jgi:beta-hydroxylase
MLTERIAQQKRRLIKNVGSKMLWSFESMMERHSLVGNSAVLDPRELPFVARLEESSIGIRRELDVVLEHKRVLPALHEISPDQCSISQDDRWKAFFLYGFGHRSAENCNRCPLTASVLSMVPGLVTAFFSILAPGKHIPRHRGVYKGLVRVHLGLKVPKLAERCRMEIGGTKLSWQEGKAFVFDDTFDHEVWNDTDEERAVLLLDVYRPLPATLSLLNKALVRAVAASPYVTDGVKNAQTWEHKIASIWPEKRPLDV